MPSRPDLSVVIVSWNTRELLSQCLQSVYETADGVTIKVLVVDNGSADGSAEMVLREFPLVRLIENAENVGFARANNQAMAVSHGRYVLLLNSDTVVRPGAFQTMCHFMDQHPEAGIVGAKLLNPDGSFQASYMDFPTLTGEVLLLTKLFRLFHSLCFPSHSLAESQEISEADWVSGACLMIRREALERVGGLDEDYFMYSEEVDWCWRVKQAGWRVFYTPDAEIVHWGGQSMGRIPLHKRTRVYRGKVLFFRKRRGHGYATFFRLVLLLSAVLKIGMWIPALVVPSKRIRAQARHNIRSYQLLMVEV